MSTRPDYLDRLKAGGKRKKTPEEAAPTCEWEGCEKPGMHKAPAGRDRPGHRHFCVEHVREYNKNYNYFSGLKEEAIAKFQRDEQATGGRPTWKMGSPDGVRASASFSTQRSGSSASLNRARAGYSSGGPAKPASRRRKLKTLEAKALESLELSGEATGDQIKTAYKALVKRHHPDANGGDRASEERFRDVIKAYQILKAANLTT